MRIFEIVKENVNLREAAELYGIDVNRYTVMSNYHLRDSGGPRELEAHGYLVRVRVRNENGQLGAIEYTILELPKEPAQKPVPVRENPIQVKPMLDVS